MTPDALLGLDIGGANLKVAHSDGIALSRPFALWKQPDRLPEELAGLLAEMPRFDRLAVTMTGELCDCFATKRDGVQALLRGVEAVAAGVAVEVWRNDGRLVSLAAALDDPLPVAAANWLALAAFAGRYSPRGPALVFDVGSTTCDLIPLRDGVPVPVGRTDLERLATGELVYTGIVRTPVCALVSALQFRGRPHRVAAEWFATTQDVDLLLDEIPESPNDRNTADGRPATKAHAHARLARMIGADSETVSFTEAVHLARQVRTAQVQALTEALASVMGLLGTVPQVVVVSGAGEFLARRIVGEMTCVSLAECLGPEISRAACAYGLAVLARERG